MRKSIYLLIGGALGVALPAVVLARLARLTWHELRSMRVMILEIKRRMSVAHAENPCSNDGGIWRTANVYFNRPGDPRGYGKQMDAFLHGGNLFGWLLRGELGDPYAPGFYGPPIGDQSDQEGVHS